MQRNNTGPSFIIHSANFIFTSFAPTTSDTRIARRIRASPCKVHEKCNATRVTGNSQWERPKMPLTKLFLIEHKSTILKAQLNLFKFARPGSLTHFADGAMLNDIWWTNWSSPINRELGQESWCSSRLERWIDCFSIVFQLFPQRQTQQDRALDVVQVRNPNGRRCLENKRNLLSHPNGPFKCQV